MKIVQEKTCCVSGHRQIAEGERDPLANAALTVMESLMTEQGVDTFLLGGALGFDTLAAQLVLLLKHINPQLRMVLVLPCQNQDKYWSPTDRAIYRDMIQRADDVIYTAAAYHNGCMQKRNRYMVEHSRFCLCYCQKSTGGTAYTMQYAVKKGLTVINIAEQRL